MFDKSLIESRKQPGQGGSWVTSLVSVILHALLLGGVVLAGVYVKKNPEIIEKPIEAFVVAQTPPPPPPPPPPPSGAVTPTRTKPVERPREQFVQPTETPQNVPQPESSGAEQEPTDAGVEGGVVGGVEGGVVGGVVGGVIGGTVGGTGTTLEQPVRVGGDVKPPVAVNRVQPVYPEIARRSRTEGIVVVEAIIDRDGNVTDARVLKGLPFGLDQAALDAVKKWKFKPGTLNGRPVPVIFTLTVRFQVS